MEEDIKILENCWVMKTDHVLDDENKKLKKAIENILDRNKELEEYKRISELTKISCCNAQNCEALNNAIRLGIENKELERKYAEKQKKIEEQEKMVDLMAEFIEVAELEEDVSKAYCLNENCKDINSFNCVKCIKEYFKKKACDKE